MFNTSLSRIGIAAVTLATSLLVTSCQPDVTVDSPTPANGHARLATGEEYVPGEMLIQFAKGSNTSSLLAALTKQFNINVVEKYAQNDGLVLVKAADNSLLTGILSKIQSTPGVEFAEPNFIYTHDAVSNDPYFTNGSLWGMYGSATSPANQYGSAAATAWAKNKTGSSSVIIGIIDEGFMTTHPDLSANTWVNPKETVNGKDDDGNGYIDDINGWDFVSNDASVYDGTADDHGTHVAGTIGGKGGNGIGVAGVCWDVKMISLKFLGTNGGTLANAVKAVDYLTSLKTRNGYNIVASNNSWGGGGYSQALEQAIQRANNAGILFIAAAGNDGRNNDRTASYPSNYTTANVVAVAAIASNGTLASFSNYGATSVDIGAPGVGIYSTLPYTGSTPAYGSYSGTSMATPHVTGAVALYRSINPSASAATTKAAILNAGVPTPSLSGKVLTGDRLNVSTF